MKTNAFSRMLVSIIVGMPISVLGMLFIAFLQRSYFFHFFKRRLKDKAIREGKVVEAHLIDSDYEERIRDGKYFMTGRQVGKYTYTFFNKTYNYLYVGNGELPKILTLYYIHNPRKASLEHELGTRESNWLVYYILSLIITSIAIYLHITKLLRG